MTVPTLNQPPGELTDVPVERWAGVAKLVDDDGTRVPLHVALERAMVALAMTARRDGYVPVTKPRATVHPSWLTREVVVRVEAYAFRSVFPVPW